jgi:hypothetical protein
MPQCQFPVFCCFCVSEKLHRKYSQNLTKQKPKFLFFPTRDGVQWRYGGGPGASHTMGWRGQPLACASRWWDQLAHLLTPPFLLYSPRRGKPKYPINFLRNILQAAADVDARSGGARSSSRHPAGEGNRRQRPSSSPCLPPKWCVCSLARSLSSPPCASCLDLVSCLSWSRSSLCNSTCCVCWDPMNIDNLSSWFMIYHLYVVYDLACSPLLVDILAE